MRTYLGRLGISVGVLLAVILGVSFAVDAYGLFGTRLVSARRFPPTERFMSPGGDRTLKAIEIAMTDRRQDILFVGSSRVAVAFDPASPTLRDLHTYNAGLFGGRLIESVAVVNYAVQRWPHLRRIVWALDFDIMFDPKDHSGDFDESGFAGQPIWKGMVRSVLSWDSVMRSISVIGQALHGRVKADMDARGRNYSHEEIVRTPPNRQQLFADVDSVEFEALSRGFQAYSLRVDDRFQQLERCLASLKARGIDVDLIASPAHARLLEVVRLSGRWDVFEDWKRRIARLVAEVDAGPGIGRTRGFDFALVHAVTSEEVPAPGGRPDTSYFYESGHFRPIVADAIVSRLTGQPSPIPDSADFGLPIDVSTAAANLADQRAKLASWRASHTDETLAMEKFGSKP